MSTNKNFLLFIRNYLKELEHSVLDPNDKILKVHYVFFPKEIEKLNLTYKHAITVGRSTSERGLIYCNIYFNIPKIAKYIRVMNSIKIGDKGVTLFIQKLFYHEYRHYLQLRYIKEMFNSLHTQLGIPNDIKEILEIDAENYSDTRITSGKKELSLDGVRKEVARKIRKLNLKNPNTGRLKLV